MRPSRALRILRLTQKQILRTSRAASWRDVMLVLALAAGEVHADTITNRERPALTARAAP